MSRSEKLLQTLLASGRRDLGLKAEPISKTTLVIRIPSSDRSHRLKVLEHLSQILGGTIEFSSRSSCGALSVDGCQVLCKPQKGFVREDGKKNEDCLVEKIREALRTLAAIDIVFESPLCSVKIPSVIGVSPWKLRPMNREKRDVVIHTANGDVPVSVKMDTAEFWESSERYYGHEIRERISDCVLPCSIRSGSFRLPKCLVFQTSDLSPAFGTDILGAGLIVARTFRNPDFKVRGSTLVVSTTKTVRTPDDFRAAYGTVWVIAQNNRRKNSSTFLRGLEIKSVTRERIPRALAVYGSLEGDIMGPKSERKRGK